MHFFNIERDIHVPGCVGTLCDGTVGNLGGGNGGNGGTPGSPNSVGGTATEPFKVIVDVRALTGVSPVFRTFRKCVGISTGSLGVVFGVFSLKTFRNCSGISDPPYVPWDGTLCMSLNGISSFLNPNSLGCCESVDQNDLP